MPRKWPKTSSVTVFSRVKEYENIFHVDNGLLFCNYCDLSVEWKHKSTIDAHCTSKKYLSQQKNFELNEKKKNQQTLERNLQASESKKIVIEDLIEAFANADIPLEKINLLLLFFKKHLKEGGAIPQASTLRQIICQNDDCARSVVNTLFVFRTHTKLVSVDFLEQVNNSTIAQTLFSPIMPQLIHLPCLAHILNLIGETWQDFPQFSLIKTFLAKIKNSFVKSPARKARYITHLRMNGVASPCKIPLPNKTRWNSWFKMVFYTVEHLQYWQDFYKKESEIDSRNETISAIYLILQDKTRLKNLLAYLESNRISTHFGEELEEIITNLNFNPSEFYSIFQAAFQSAYKKFEAHIPDHPTRPLFRAVRLFDPKYMHTGNNQRHNIYQYSIISELDNPSDDLLHEWGIYCGLEFDINNENDLDKYWNDLSNRLLNLSKIALDYIWLPISSCAVERSFSLYNTLLDKDRQNLTKESLKQLNMMYFNRDY
ncbi:6664_t:CDS:2 [Diversispora eburnea]|uniref:6664_t:CDS:1 n=1 Tax=Diversispora eburnea TaxID=1213867 RepID=A0A9N8VYN9_9GLOM|nr:6664_t:CDS:2 [Diversispora eburnea]